MAEALSPLFLCWYMESFAKSGRRVVARVSIWELAGVKALSVLVDPHVLTDECYGFLVFSSVR